MTKQQDDVIKTMSRYKTSDKQSYTGAGKSRKQPCFDVLETMEINLEEIFQFTSK